MTEETQIAPGEWALMRIGHKDRDTGTKAHRIDGNGRTLCGFGAKGRLIVAPSGTKRCLLCSIGEGA